MNLVLGVVLAAVVSAQPVAVARRVAVLDFNASWAADCADKSSLSRVEREKCDVPRLFADQARSGALSVLRPPGFVVMTRENTAQILKDMGGQCSEGECEVETARLLGASVVVSGEVTLLEGTYIVSLKVHDVATAALMGTGHARGKSKLEAFDNVRAETEKMLRGSVGLEGTAVAVKPAVRIEAAVPVAEPVAEPQPEPPTAPTVEPALADSESSGTTPWGERRFYFELGAGVRSLQSKMTGSVMGFDLPDYNSGTADFAPSIRIGMRTTRSFAIEASATLLYNKGAVAETPFYTSPPNPPQESSRFTFGAKLNSTFDAGLTVVYRPLGNSHFALTLGSGLIGMYGSARGYGSASSNRPVEKHVSGNAPYVGFGTRLDLPFSSSWALALRLGVVVAKSTLQADAGDTMTTYLYTTDGTYSNIPGRVSLDPGWLASVDASLGIRRDF